MQVSERVLFCVGFCFVLFLFVCLFVGVFVCLFVVLVSFHSVGASAFPLGSVNSLMCGHAWHMI